MDDLPPSVLPGRISEPYSKILLLLLRDIVRSKSSITVDSNIHVCHGMSDFLEQFHKSIEDREDGKVNDES